jgi:putative salt-induced outer membrane protein
MKYFLLLLLLPMSVMAELTHESEVSSVVTGGNSNVETYLFKTSNQLEQERMIYRFNGHYTYGEASEIVSARNWDVAIKLERRFSEHFAFYFAEIVEGYRFQGIKARYNTDGGFKYYFVRTDERKIFSEAGLRYTIEDQYGSAATEYEKKGRLYAEINDKPNENFSYRLWIEYIPNFTNTNDYLVLHEASITSILNSVFALKFAFKGIYDDEPVVEGNKNYDYTYTTSIVARF